MLGLLGRVRRVEGLDPVEPHVAHEALDQIAHLLGVLDVPVRVGDHGEFAARLLDEIRAKAPIAAAGRGAA